jgi:FkbM family methyltransferase
MSTTDRFSIVEEGKPNWPEEYMARLGSQKHCEDVLAGSYDIPWWPEKAPVILDIGANVGAFTRWAAKRWPGCIIHAYEPHPDNFALLEKTAAATDTIGCIYLHRQAVLNENGKKILFNPAHNCGEFSFYRQGTDRPIHGEVEVEVIDGKDLPKADILKMDCEGSEGAILTQLYNSNRLGEFSAIMLEYHNEQDGINIRNGLEFNGFTLVGEHVPFPNRGELQFLRNDLVPVSEFDEQNHGQ